MERYAMDMAIQEQATQICQASINEDMLELQAIKELEPLEALRNFKRSRHTPTRDKATRRK